MPESPHPIFSIITITFNAEKVLRETICSVIEQKAAYPHIEYILVDGASKDHTMDIVKQYEKEISKSVSEPDGGLYDAMNKGIRMATGDYLCFLNAGDTFHTADVLKQMVASIQGNTLPDVLYGETAIVNASRQFLHLRRLRAPETLTWQSFRKGMLVCHQAFFAKRSIATPYNTSYRYSSDFDWCIRILKKAPYIHNTHLTIIDYLDEGLTTAHRYDSLWERFHIMAHHYGAISTTVYHVAFLFRLLFLRSK